MRTSSTRLEGVERRVISGFHKRSHTTREMSPPLMFPDAGPPAAIFFAARARQWSSEQGFSQGIITILEIRDTQKARYAARRIIY